MTLEELIEEAFVRAMFGAATFKRLKDELEELRGYQDDARVTHLSPDERAVLQAAMNRARDHMLEIIALPHPVYIAHGTSLFPAAADFARFSTPEEDDEFQFIERINTIREADGSEHITIETTGGIPK